MLIINKLKKKKRFILAAVIVLTVIIGVSRTLISNLVYANQNFDVFLMRF